MHMVEDLSRISRSHPQFCLMCRYASFRGHVSYDGVCVTVSCQKVSISIALDEIIDTNYCHCIVFCKLSSREVLSIQKCLSSKSIAFPMWFYYSEEVLHQNFSSVMDNVLIDSVSRFSSGLPRG